MPPKIKITKEEIINCAVELVRKGVPVNARTIAGSLNCSTQPIFSNFASMDELHLSVLDSAVEICKDYMKKEVEKGEYPPYKANGMAYIRFAKEEKELFKLLYMRESTNNFMPNEVEINDKMEEIVENNTGLSKEEVKLFHLEMWAVVHGIAAMFWSGYLDFEWDLVSRILTDSYQGLRKQFSME